MKVYKNLFEQIISAENLFLAWEEFRRGKSGRADVQRFEMNLEENIFELHRQLANFGYKHKGYHAFYITDPKQRLIHKASVRDRVLHHAVFTALNPLFEPTFISHSFSCRVGKGTHKGVKALAKMLNQVSQNNTGPCFALKCDIYKFFASVNHTRLLAILSKKIKDKAVIELLTEIIGSFVSPASRGRGLPIGNLTSQLFANIYMNEFDQFIKHQLKVKHYIRYTDDFVVLSTDKQYLENLLPEIRDFLGNALNLELHPHKIVLRKYSSGVDFLGYVILPYHTKLRTKNRHRIEAKINSRNLTSYLGVLSHANSHKLKKKLLKSLEA